MLHNEKNKKKKKKKKEKEGNNIYINLRASQKIIKPRLGGRQSRALGKLWHSMWHSGLRCVVQAANLV